jgi:dienelactone hydrolase
LIILKVSEIKKYKILIIACVLSFFFGGLIGKNGTRLTGALLSFLENPTPRLPDFPSLQGDPQFVNFVQRQQVGIPRPNYSSNDSLRLWQESLRSNLRHQFSSPDLAQIQRVKFREVSAIAGEKGIVRKKIIFDSFDGTQIPGFLFVDPQVHQTAAILVLPGHVLEGESGIAQTGGLVESYQHSVAQKLAQAGFVTLTIELRGFGLLGKPLNTEHRLVAYNAILGGSFYKAVVSKDIQFAINFLQTLDQVDSHRIGITGVSYGGEMAVTYAALDKRIQAVVFQGFGGLLGPYEGKVGGRWDQPHYCHIIPGSPNILFQEDLFFLIAPRPLLGVRGTQDIEGDPQEFRKEVKKFYEKIDASASFEFLTVPGGHEYFIEPAVSFFKRNL